MGAARREANELLGFDAGHTDVLQRPETVERILQSIESVKSVYPEDHLRVLVRDGEVLIVVYSVPEDVFD